MWQNNQTVSNTYATADSQNAYAYIAGTGWRRIKPGTTDGVTNAFLVLNAAKAHGRPVNYYEETGNLISRVTMS